MRSVIRLPFTFEAGPLQREVEDIPDGVWSPHFQPDYFEGEWSGLALRSIGGTVERLFPYRHAGGVYLDTPMFDRCPAMRTVVDTFECGKEMVRLLRLAPNSRVLEHRDEKLNAERGVVRVHVPVLTNASVYFLLDGERVVLREGEAWVLDLSLPHRIDNRGTSDRIHLVIDCLSNAWLEELFQFPGVGGTVGPFTHD